MNLQFWNSLVLALSHISYVIFSKELNLSENVFLS